MTGIPYLIKQEVKKGHRELPHKKRCDYCGSIEYNLYPYTLRVCKGCAEQIYTNRPQAVKFGYIYKMNGEYCDICGAKTYKVWTVNPYLCINCTEKLWVNRRKYHLEDD